MSDVTCLGCGAENVRVCSECSHSNWYIGCGCAHHGDHAACGKRCADYDGCKHPRGLVLSGTLEESEQYSDEVPSRDLVARAIAEARIEAKRKHKRRMLKLDRLELSLTDFPS